MTLMALLTGAAASSALTYLLDPDSGRRRRALLRDQAVRLQHRVRDDVQASARDAANRARGLAAQAREKLPFGDHLPSTDVQSWSEARPATRGAGEAAIAGAVLATLLVPFARRTLGRMMLAGLPQLVAIGAVLAARTIERQERTARDRGRDAGSRRGEGADGADDDAPVTMIDPNL